MKSVLYYVNSDKIVNGTLFYAMEYFLLLNTATPSQDITFVLFNCDETSKEKILDIFREKYIYNLKLESKIIAFTEHKYLTKLGKTLILDNNTFSKCKDFIKEFKWCYSNDERDFTSHKSSMFYGFYSYQNFTKKTRLKLGFDFFKIYPNNGEQIYYSNLNFEFKIPKDNAILKRPNTSINIAKECYKYVYIHCGKLEKNNRLIPEAAFLGKEFEIIYDRITKYTEIDSCKERYELVKSGKIENLRLTLDDILVQDFLNETY